MLQVKMYRMIHNFIFVNLNIYLYDIYPLVIIIIMKKQYNVFFLFESLILSAVGIHHHL